MQSYKPKKVSMFGSQGSNKCQGYPSADPDAEICGKTVYKTEEVKATKMIFHKRCFRCFDCRKVLSKGDEVASDVGPKCQACHTKKNLAKGSTPQGTPNQVQRKKVSSSTEAMLASLDSVRAKTKFEGMKLGGTAEVCSKCGKGVGHAERTTAVDRVFHVECLKCCSCDKVLRGGDISVFEGEPYCQTCGDDLAGIKFAPKKAFTATKGTATDSDAQAREALEAQERKAALPKSAGEEVEDLLAQARALAKAEGHLDSDDDESD